MLRRLPELLLTILLMLSVSACVSDTDGAEADLDEGHGDTSKSDGVHDEKSTSAARSWVIGTSNEGRPIVAELYGDEGPVLFLMSTIHGDERLAMSFGERIRTVLQAGMAEQVGIRIFFLPAANPDGIAYDRRENAHWVDLNRNFPSENFGTWGSAGGSDPLSEPESTAIHAAWGWAKPSAAISAHCCYPQIDYDGPGLELATAMAGAMDSPFLVKRIGSRSGSFGSYAGVDEGVPTITLEFGHAEVVDPLEQLENVELSMWAAAAWTAKYGEDPGPILPNIEAASFEGLSSFELGVASNDLPIRADWIGSGSTSTSYLLSGIDGAQRRGEHVAESLRRWAQARTGELWSPLVVVTAVNPAGLSTGGSLNADGVDVAADLAAAEPTSPEAKAVLETLDQAAPAVVYLVEDSDADRFTVHGERAEELAGALGNADVAVAKADELASEHRPLVERIVSAGHTVVVFEVASEFLEAQGVHDYASAEQHQAAVWATLP